MNYAEPTEKDLERVRRQWEQLLRRLRIKK
jgi:hypothetical protein